MNYGINILQYTIFRKKMNDTQIKAYEYLIKNGFFPAGAGNTRAAGREDFLPQRISVEIAERAGQSADGFFLRDIRFGASGKIPDISKEPDPHFWFVTLSLSAPGLQVFLWSAHLRYSSL